MCCDDAGAECEASRHRRPQSMLDGFEAGIMSTHWSVVIGGSLDGGCGTLLPVAHGKSLYFNGCAQRYAVTVELDLTKARSPLAYLLLYFANDRSSGPGTAVARVRLSTCVRTKTFELSNL